MAKRESKASKKAEEAEERAGDDEAEESEGHAVSTRASAAQQRRARMRERIAAASAHDEHDEADHAHDHDHGHGHDHHDDEDEVDTSNDPSWWVPHVVLGALVVVGILGFFGAFNSVAAKLGYKGVPALAETGHEAAAAPAETHAAPPPRPMPQQQPQPPREMFGAKHLLVMYKGSMRAPANITRTKEEAKARAEEARKKALAGAKFEDLVKEYSDEPGAGARGGDLGKFPKGRMVGPFQEGLEKTKVGGISDLVETPFGFHVILRTQ